jgi:signal transduction histidine kinase/CheY-like chemotaxis protein
LKTLSNIFKLIKYNGVVFNGRGIVRRLLVHFNLIWYYSYVAVLVFTLILAVLPFGLPNTFVVGWAVVHAAFILCFLLCKFGYFLLARHLFLITVYGLVVFGNIIFGEGSYFNAYFFAFLPTAYNIFSYKRNKYSILFYIFIVPVIVFATKFALPQITVPFVFSTALQTFVTCYNIAVAFILVAIYAGFMLLKTNQKQYELMSLSGSLQLTIDNAPASIWSIDKDFKLVVFNKRFKEYVAKAFGINNVNVGDNLRPIIEAMPTDSRFSQIINEVYQGKAIFEEFFLNNDYHEIKGEALINRKGKIVGATFASRKITDLKVANEILVKEKQVAETEAERRSLLLSNMSHELRTPLNGLNGLIKLAKDEHDVTQIQQSLATMNDVANHMMSLVNNILDYHKLGAGKVSLDITRFNLAESIHNITPLFENLAATKGINFEVVTDSKCDVFVKADEVKIKQVIINIVANAIKFTHKGSVTLRLHITNNPDYVDAHFAVTDTGIGIKEQKINTIFESFTQADANTTRKYGGSGLGLTIATGLLKVMGGQLSVESQFGQGSSFSFNLQLPKSIIGNTIDNLPEQDVSITSFTALPKLTVLLAEDNAINQIVAQKMLQKWQVKVHLATNGQEALQLVQLHNFNVVLMDLDMPIMDGYEATTKIKQHNANLPIVALTAASFENMQHILQQKGFAQVVQKPFMPVNLYNAIASYNNN